MSHESFERGVFERGVFERAVFERAVFERGVFERHVFEYALVQAVPRAERGECLNVGVLLYCQARDFLAVQVHVDGSRLRVLDAAVDVEGVEQAAVALQRTCDGEGPAGGTSLGQRFRWLTAPRSTVLRAGQVHSGLTGDPVAELARLVDVLVR